MRIHIATDHAGFDFSADLQQHLIEAGHEVVDHGPVAYEALDDYPAFCIRAAQAVVADQRAGVDPPGGGVGGSGNGEHSAANKGVGGRAALVWNLSRAGLAPPHKQANVMSLGGRPHTLDEVFSFVDAFIAEPFSGDERHARRIAQVGAYETEGTLVDTPAPRVRS
jgi:ribose 5-phosphate isomerase B